MKNQQGESVSIDQADIVSRLEQLEEAMNKGLISRDEYDRARQSILDDLG